jgi:cytochrome c biogenesis protein CcdA
MKFTSLELHLLLVELVLNDVVGTLLSVTVLAIPLLLVVDLTHAHRDGLPIVAGAVVVIVIEHLNGV